MLMIFNPHCPMPAARLDVDRGHRRTGTSSHQLEMPLAFEHEINLVIRLW